MYTTINEKFLAKLFKTKLAKAIPNFIKEAAFPDFNFDIQLGITTVKFSMKNIKYTKVT